jgi:hypothetical protein
MQFSPVGSESRVLGTICKSSCDDGLHNVVALTSFDVFMLVDGVWNHSGTKPRGRTAVIVSGRKGFGPFAQNSCGSMMIRN